MHIASPRHVVVNC